MSREQFQRQLKAIAVQQAREIIANQEENKAKAQAAATLFQSLRNAPTWMIAPNPKPQGFTNPDEIWSQPVTIKDPDDDA